MGNPDVSTTEKPKEGDDKKSEEKQPAPTTKEELKDLKDDVKK
jgi:hypothetical protein